MPKQIRIPQKFRVTLLLSLAAALVSFVGQAQPIVINEIHYDPDQKTQPLEFIELHNPGTNTVNLGGYRFSAGVDYAFPPSTLLPAGGYVVVAEDPVFLTATYGVAALGPWIGQLDNEGEKITLRDAGGDVVDEVDYRAEFPWPIGCAGEGGSMELINPSLDNNLAGSWRTSDLPTGVASVTNETVLLPPQSVWRYRKGTNEASAPISAWRQLSFVEDATWLTGTAGIGFGDGDDNTVLSDMVNNYWSVFLRKQFVVTNAIATNLALRLRHLTDDGCIIWLNGKELARPYITTVGDKVFNSGTGTTSHEAVWEDIYLPITNGMFNVGTNQLAVHVFNQTLNSSDLSADMELRVQQILLGTPTTPSPGLVNRQFRTNAAPQIRQVTHAPQQPRPSDPIILTAKVTDPNGVASVTALVQDVSPGDYLPAFLSFDPATLLANPEADLLINPAYTNAANWSTVAMLDNGLGNDALAGDGVYTATLAARNANRHLVRYKISATDLLGASVTVPTPDDPSLNRACYVYEGVPSYTASVASVHPNGPGQVYDTNLMNSLPVYQLITSSNDYDHCVAYTSTLQIGKTHPARDAFNWVGTFVYDGVVYDNIRYRLRQANNRYAGNGRRSFRYRFNLGHYLDVKDERGEGYSVKWRTLNTSKMHSFTSAHYFGLRERMNFDLWRLVGVPASFSHYAHMRVIRGTNELDQYFGDFQGLTMAVEDYDSRFLNAHDLPDGNIYKLVDGFTDGYELKRNQGRDSVVTVDDYNQIFNEAFLNLFPTRDEAWLRANVRWDKWYAYHAIAEAIRHADLHPYYTYGGVVNQTWHKNQAWYFEPHTNSPYGLFWTLPHDTDATWGRGYHDERLGPGKVNNSVGIDYPKLFIFGHFGTNFVGTTTNLSFRREFRNVIRDIRDLVFTGEVITNMLTDTANMIRAFSLADRDRWKNAPAAAGFEPDIAIEAREKEILDFAFLSEFWYGTNVPGGRAICLDVLAADEGDGAAIPFTPTITYSGLTNYPVNGIAFSTGPFTDPQGNGTFGAMEWRVGEVTDTNAPAYDPLEARHYEYTKVWSSGILSNYSASISVPPNALRVGHAYRARVRTMDNTGRWSHWSAPLPFIVAAPDGSTALVNYLRVTELMYNPILGDGYEFIELHNSSTNVTLDLGGASFTKGVTYTFPAGITLAPNGVLLVVSQTAWTNLTAFRAHYALSTNVPIYGPYVGNFSNGGEEVRIKTALGGVDIVSFTYTDAPDWPTRADGEGSSIEIINEQADANDPFNWRASGTYNGTPGILSTPISTVRINEILTHTDPPLVDSVELYNAGASPVNIGGWYLSDSTQYRKYKFPTNTVIAPFSYLVVTETNFNPYGDWNTTPGKPPVNTNTHFGFNSYNGDDVYLVEANASDVLLHFADSVNFGATANAESLGRWPNGAGELYPMTSRTFGAANAAPRPGRVIISEIMYHPADTNNAGILEFIEIRNAGTTNELLNNWTLDGAVTFNFTPGTTLAPGSNLVIVSFPPTLTASLNTFRAAYGSNAVIVGPWSGQLNNAGETVWLRRADEPPAGLPGFYPQMEEERVRYSPSAPWPLAADGFGSSLQRQNVSTWADTAANWVALAPTAGSHSANPAFDAWRAGHFTSGELANPAISGANADADSDGHSNWQEFVTDTDPRNAASHLRIGIRLSAQNEPIISYESSAARSYVLEKAAPGLGQGWIPIFSGAPGNGSVEEWLLPVNTNGFFRVGAGLP